MVLDVLAVRDVGGVAGEVDTDAAQGPHGRGVEQDYEQAREWYLKAANMGNMEAQYSLATMYKLGQGDEEQDYSMAKEWYEKAAKQGFDRAQHFVANRYNHSEGVEEDLVKAFTYYKLAAEQGFALAQALLAQCYFYGRGTAEDVLKANDLLIKVAAQKEPQIVNNKTFRDLRKNVLREFVALELSKRK